MRAELSCQTIDHKLSHFFLHATYREDRKGIPKHERNFIQEDSILEVNFKYIFLKQTSTVKYS